MKVVWLVIAVLLVFGIATKGPVKPEPAAPVVHPTVRCGGCPPGGSIACPQAGPFWCGN